MRFLILFITLSFVLGACSKVPIKDSSKRSYNEQKSAEKEGMKELEK